MMTSRSSTTTERSHSPSPRPTSIVRVLDSPKLLIRRMHQALPTVSSMPNQHCSLPRTKVSSARRLLLHQQLPITSSPSWQIALLQALGLFRRWAALRSSMSTSQILSNRLRSTVSSPPRRSTRHPSRYVTSSPYIVPEKYCTCG